MKKSLLVGFLVFVFLGGQAVAQDLDQLLDNLDKKTEPVKTQTKNKKVKPEEKAKPGTIEERLQNIESKINEWEQFGEVTKKVTEQPLFAPANDNEGIYPDLSVLSDIMNNFRKADAGTLEKEKWQAINSSNPSRDFYLWATLTALAPNGENQYYTAVALRNAKLYDMAIRAYQAVLDYWPDATGLSKEGYKWSYADAAAEAITELGGTPRKQIVRPFSFSGGRYLGWMVTSSYGRTNYDSWTIGQRHQIDLKLDLHPAQEIHGFVTIAIKGSRPWDITAYRADNTVGEERHIGAYVDQVDLQLNTKIIKGQLYKDVPTQNWDDVLDIHPKWWNVLESQERGWSYPSGFLVQEKFFPYNTSLMFEAGPAPNSIENENCYYVRATPEFGPVKLMLARRQTIATFEGSDNPYFAVDKSLNAVYLNGNGVDTIDVKANISPVLIEGQSMLSEESKKMFYSTNDNTLLPYFSVEPKTADFMSFAGRLRYDKQTARYTKMVPLQAEIWFIKSGKWVYMGNKTELGGDIYIGPLSYFFLHLNGLYRTNPNPPDYEHPGTVFRDNRAAQIFDTTLTFDLTPNTLMRETWGDKNLTQWEDALVALEIGYKIEKYPTFTDPLPREWGFGAGGIYPEANDTFGLYPCSLGSIHGAAVVNVLGWKFTIESVVGNKQAERGTEYAVRPWTQFFNSSFEANYKGRSIFRAEARFNDWVDYLYDPLPETWASKWGVSADKNILISVKQAIYNSFVELDYEYIVSEDLYKTADAYHYVSMKYDITF